MQLILNAIYKNGSLIDKDLGAEKEGKNFKVLLFDTEPIDIKKQKFFSFMEKFSNYKKIISLTGMKFMNDNILIDTTV